MDSKTTKPLTDAELEAYEAQRDLAADLLQSVCEMKAGEGRDLQEARRKRGMAAQAFEAYFAKADAMLMSAERALTDEDVVRLVKASPSE